MRLKKRPFYIALMINCIEIFANFSSALSDVLIAKMSWRWCFEMWIFYVSMKNFTDHWTTVVICLSELWFLILHFWLSNSKSEKNRYEICLFLNNWSIWIQRKKFHCFALSVVCSWPYSELASNILDLRVKSLVYWLSSAFYSLFLMYCSDDLLKKRRFHCEFWKNAQFFLTFSFFFHQHIQQYCKWFIFVKYWSSF